MTKITLDIHKFPCLNDNYGYLVHEPVSGKTAAIDTPDAEKYLAEADRKGWTVTHILNTHWHPDHAGGNKAIAEATGATVVAPQEVEKLTPIDRVVGNGVGHVEIVSFDVNQLIFEDQRLRVPVGVGGVEQAERPVEAPLFWQRVFFVAKDPVGAVSIIPTAGNVPLAGEERPVARALQHLGNSDAAVSQITLVGGHTEIGCHLPDSGLVRVQAGEQSGPGWTAPGAVVHLRKPEPAISQ